MEWAPGSSCGRYQLIEEIGAGGMGVVVAAHDPALDRRVALKLLRPDRADDEVERARLLREAQAMARLVHPNVITVHDVGVLEDQVFVAMELIDGGTLRRWLKTATPRWRDRLAVLVRAGRGLEAAHAAGLVHRDFKPDNVLLGKDGRVLVTDFGLARSAASAPDEADLFLGTPAYMAPEQHHGLEADARADQFAFCVTLWEALFAQRPFALEDTTELSTILALASEITSGRVREPPRDARVPQRLERALRRGLAVNPARRWPSMTELLAELEEIPRVARRRVAVGTGVLVAAATAALFVLRPPVRPSPCRGSEARLAGVWDATVRERLGQSFARSGRPYAGDTAARVARILDGFTADWVAVRADACEATEVRREQSPQLLDARMWCLDERLAEVGALAAVLAAEASPAAVNGAIKQAQSLTPLSVCAQDRRLLDTVPAPADPAVRARVEALRDRALAADLRGRSSAVGPALAELQQVVAEARATGHLPLVAQALDSRGALEQRQGDPRRGAATLREAVQLAAAARDDRLIAHIWVRLIIVLGQDSELAADAPKLEPVARSAIARLGGDTQLEVQLLRGVGVALRNAGELEAASARFDEALALVEGPAADAERANLLVSMGILSRFRGRSEEALARIEEARAIYERVYGPEHYALATVLEHLSNTLQVMHRCEEARARAEQSLAMSIRILGADNVELEEAHIALANAQTCLHDADGARASYQRAIALAEKEGPSSARVAQALDMLGVGLVQLGRHDEAIAPLSRALPIAEKHRLRPLWAMTLRFLGEAHLGAGRPSQALPFFERALAMYEQMKAEVDIGYCREGIAKAKTALVSR